MNKWVIDNFLKQDHFELMLDTFPNLQPTQSTTIGLYCADEHYRRFITEQEGWRRFHNMVFSKKFWEPFFPNINLYTFNASYREHKSGAIDPKEKRPFLYSRIDIGYALQGYDNAKGLFIENKQRVISGLLYFTDQSEIQGGEYNFCTPDGRVTECVRIKENRAIISHQDADAWHSIAPMRKGTRRYVQFSLNSTCPIYRRN